MALTGSCIELCSTEHGQFALFEIVMNWKKRKHSLKLQALAKRIHSNSGFTLIEIVIALSIVAIAMAVIVPVSLNMLPGYRMKKAARELVANMQRAKMNAVKEGKFWRIAFNKGGTTYDIIRDFGGPDEAVTTTVNLTNYGSGVTYGFGNAPKNWNKSNLKATSQRSSVTFSPRGTCGAASTYITNQDNTVCLAVSTNVACNMKLRKYNGMLPFTVSHWMD